VRLVQVRWWPSVSDDLQPLDPETGVQQFIEHRRPSVRDTTLENAKTRLGHFLEWCEEAEIENLNVLTGRHLSDFVRWRRGQVAPITLQKQLTTPRQALRYWADIEAVRDGLAEKLHAPELPDGAEAKDVQLPTRRATDILDHLDRYKYASREHAILGLLWRTGMRRGTLQAIDLDDLEPDDHAVHLRHRPETDTPLKNGDSGERMVYLGPRWFEVLTEYIGQHRPDETDEYGREPLLTTSNGRMSDTTIYDVVNRATQPCRYGECPHDRDPDDCEAVGAPNVPSKCPSSRSPHAIRRGAITHHLNEDISPEVVSERADVSLDVLYRHYDARTPREKMDVRKRELSDS
jgi:site-specific recombinase XerD